MRTWELNKLNTSEIREESFEISRLCSGWKRAYSGVKMMGTESSCFSEGLRLLQAAHTLGFICCACAILATEGLQGVLCSERLLRAAVVGGL